MDTIDTSAYALGDGLGFLKTRELFGWTDSDARAAAWRAALSKDATAFDRACLACKGLDFRHAPSGFSLLGLVMTLEAGDDDLETPLLRIALSRGADPNFPLDAQGGLALHRCALEERIDAALLLLDRGANPRARPSGAVSLDDLAKAGHRCARLIIKLSRES